MIKIILYIMSILNSNTLLTTAISYTNGSPHIGHLYESILADFMKKSLGLFSNTKLLTGTDEHGKKIESTAQNLNTSPIELCNYNSNKFKEMNNKLNVSYDYFIRTTQSDHKTLVKESIIKSYNNNDIYLSNYSGYYNVREECFVSDIDAAQTDYLDPVTGKPYDKICEESYYFKLKDYKDHIKELLDSGLIFPPNKFPFDERLNSIKDLSISRTSFNWGIDFPIQDSKNKHIVYVWFDALLNYVTGAKLLNEENQFNKIIHIIGKDILWFHSVIYPAILKSCEHYRYQPTNILVHGFILDKNGTKMSKSLGNVINIDELLIKFPIEAIRYYLIMETIWGEDIKFNEERLKDLYNNNLIKDFGNLFQRLFTLSKPLQFELNKYFMVNQSLIINLQNTFLIKLKEISESYSLNKYKTLIFALCSHSNKEINDQKPWEKNVDFETKIKVIGNLLIELNQIMILLYPIITEKINELRGLLGWSSDNIYKLDLNIKVDKVKAFISIK
jgi:methionyl-tRNA synthetase